MNTLYLIVLGLAMGLAFGIALEKSRVFEPGMIVGQFQLRNFILLKVFLSAVATGLVVLAALDGLGLVTLHPKATVFAGNAVGGLLLGAGMAIAGACPGTVLAQIGAGYRDAWAVLAGGLAGALTFGFAHPVLQPMLLSPSAGKLTLATTTGLPFWLLALMTASLLVAALFWLEAWRPWPGELGRDNDGLRDGADDADAKHGDDVAPKHAVRRRPF